MTSNLIVLSERDLVMMGTSFDRRSVPLRTIFLIIDSPEYCSLG